MQYYCLYTCHKAQNIGWWSILQCIGRTTWTVCRVFYRQVPWLVSDKVPDCHHRNRLSLPRYRLVRDRLKMWKIRLHTGDDFKVCRLLEKSACVSIENSSVVLQLRSRILPSHVVIKVSQRGRFSSFFPVQMNIFLKLDGQFIGLNDSWQFQIELPSGVLSLNPTQKC